MGLPVMISLVLAGGASRRMGYDKAQLVLGRQTLLERVCEIAAQVSDRPPIVLGQPRPGLALSVRWQADPWPGCGPPKAIAAALQTLPPPLPAWVLVLACDLPCLEVDRLREWRSQVERLDPWVLAAVPRWDVGASGAAQDRPQWEPLCGFYRPAAGESLAAFLAGGGRWHKPAGGKSLQGWLDRLAQEGQVVPLVPSAADAARLTNCNTPEEWAAALYRLI